MTSINALFSDKVKTYVSIYKIPLAVIKRPDKAFYVLIVTMFVSVCSSVCNLHSCISQPHLKRMNTIFLSTISNDPEIFKNERGKMTRSRTP